MSISYRHFSVYIKRGAIQTSQKKCLYVIQTTYRQDFFCLHKHVYIYIDCLYKIVYIHHIDNVYEILRNHVYIHIDCLCRQKKSCLYVVYIIQTKYNVDNIQTQTKCIQTRYRHIQSQTRKLNYMLTILKKQMYSTNQSGQPTPRPL